MENATKALLIAAAVLIAIVLIALGVNLLGSAQDTSGDAEEVANYMNQAIDGKIEDINTAIHGL